MNKTQHGNDNKNSSQHTKKSNTVKPGQKQDTSKKSRSDNNKK